MRKLILMIGALFMITAQSMAGSADKIFPYSYQMKILGNGLRVIVIPTSYPNIVSLQIPVSVGSRNEVEPHRSGFAHFFEHMMFRGTEKFPSEKYGEILKNIGGDQNAYTSDDFTNYHTTFSKEDLETMLMLEADRFQHLKYSIEGFKTESRAVLGEYNKNSSSPVNKLFEVQRNLAFDKSTYKHTTMGFIEDVENMPNMFDYSQTFFKRFYRPENTTVIVSGDVKADNVFKLVEKYWGAWQKGDYKSSIPVEPEHTKALYAHVPWKTATSPWITVAFHGPAFSTDKKDMAAMDLISSYAFSRSSALYQKLVVQEQKADVLAASFPDHKDPFLLTILARVRDVKDIWYVRDEIQKTCTKMRNDLVDASRLNDIKSNLKYGFAAGLDNSEAIASALVSYVARTHDPEAVNKVYHLYDALKPADLKSMANRYFTDGRMVTVSLAHGDLPQVESKTGSVDSWLKEMQKPLTKIVEVVLKNNSPIVDLRFMFHAGSASDPKGKEGLAALTAAMITNEGSKQMKYSDIQKALFPLAAGFGNQVDKEITVFRGTVHKDNLSPYFAIISGQLLQPAWDTNDFKRVKFNLINAIKIGLRGNNDEELGKEALYEMIYNNHPYGALNIGHIDALEKLTLKDLKDFYKKHYTLANLTIGLAGNYSDAFHDRLLRVLQVLPEGPAVTYNLPQPQKIKGLNAKIIQKETRATAISFGFPIDVTRADNDFVALWLVRSYFGEHRNSSSHLYQRIREIRGMNYGDYAYIEYFPGGMFQFYPRANLDRQQQIFQVWIRPVVPKNAHFAIRTAMFELHKLVSGGMTEKDFEATRNFLMKYVNILVKSQGRQLGYLMDSKYYHIPEFTQYVKDGLKKLTLSDVNRVIQRYLRDKNIDFVFITRDADSLKKQLVSNTVSPITYDAKKPTEILQEDKLIENYILPFKAEKVKIVPLDNVFK